jgi:hypothetical protein
MLPLVAIVPSLYAGCQKRQMPPDPAGPGKSSSSALPMTYRLPRSPARERMKQEEISRRSPGERSRLDLTSNRVINATILLPNP